MIKLLFMDVDGTLTDGKIHIGSNGEMFKSFDVKDGCGIHDVLPKYEITPVVITARESEIAKKRCQELGIELLYQNCRDKKCKMIEVAESYGLNTDKNGIIKQTAYIGDDLLDIQCMEIAEFSASPSDAIQIVKDSVDFVSKYSGGNGAVREFIEWLIR